MTGQKISDSQLEKEIKNGKTRVQIAREYGYKLSTGTLSKRAEKLGYQPNKITKRRKNDKGINIFINNTLVTEMLEKSGNKWLEKDGDKYFPYQLQRVTCDGCLVLKPENSAWRKIKE